MGKWKLKKKKKKVLKIKLKKKNSKFLDKFTKMPLTKILF